MPTPANPLKSKVRKRCAREDRQVVLLNEIYDLLTLMPGSAKDYAREEFAREHPRRHHRRKALERVTPCRRFSQASPYLRLTH